MEANRCKEVLNPKQHLTLALKWVLINPIP